MKSLPILLLFLCFLIHHVLALERKDLEDGDSLETIRPEDLDEDGFPTPRPHSAGLEVLKSGKVVRDLSHSEWDDIPFRSTPSIFDRDSPKPDIDLSTPRFTYADSSRWILSNEDVINKDLEADSLTRDISGSKSQFTVDVATPNSKGSLLLMDYDATNDKFAPESTKRFQLNSESFESDKTVEELLKDTEDEPKSHLIFVPDSSEEEQTKEATSEEINKFLKEIDEKYGKSRQGSDVEVKEEYQHPYLKTFIINDKKHNDGPYFKVVERKRRHSVQEQSGQISGLPEANKPVNSEEKVSDVKETSGGISYNINFEPAKSSKPREKKNVVSSSSASSEANELPSSVTRIEATAQEELHDPSHTVIKDDSEKSDSHRDDDIKWPELPPRTQHMEWKEENDNELAVERLDNGFGFAIHFSSLTLGITLFFVLVCMTIRLIFKMKRADLTHQRFEDEGDAKVIP